VRILLLFDYLRFWNSERPNSFLIVYGKEIKAEFVKLLFYGCIAIFDLVLTNLLKLCSLTFILRIKSSFDTLGLI
jgi:hypothetical protein